MSGKPKPVVIGIFAIVLIGAVAATTLVLQNQKFSSLNPFPVEAYFSSPKNMLGNRYSLDALIDAQILWKEGVGKIMTVKPLSASSVRVPVFLSDSLPVGLHMGQRYRMQVVIKQRGLIWVEELEKY